MYENFVRTTRCIAVWIPFLWCLVNGAKFDFYGPASGNNLFTEMTVQVRLPSALFLCYAA